MLQNNTFSGQPVFSQIVGLINRASFNKIVKEQAAYLGIPKAGPYKTDMYRY